VALRYTIRFGDIDALAITKLDILDSLETVRAAVAYRVGGRRERLDDTVPPHLDGGLEVEYRDFPGWRTSTAGCRDFASLPRQAKDYLQFIADFTRRPIAMVSVGKERSQLVRFHPWLAPR
jgi:adenylosuccinate synthase